VLGKDLSSCEDWSPSSSPFWLVLMREASHMVERDFDGAECMTEAKSVMSKVAAVLLKPLL
jgi:hypothetical protein